MKVNSFLFFRKGVLKILEIQLSQSQISQIAKAIDLKDIKDYIETHQEEYQQFLKEEEKTTKEQIKKYEKFAVTNALEKNCNKRKIYNTDFFIELKKYSEE